MRIESAASHGVISGAKRAANYDTVNFGTAALATALISLAPSRDNALMFVFFADNKAGDILQEEQRNFALHTQLNKMGAFQRTL